MNKNKLINAKYLILILICVISFFILLYLIIFVRKPDILEENLKNGITENEIDDSNQKIESDIVLIENFNELFSEYKGNITRIKLSDKIREIFSKELYELSNENINQSYYSDNSSKLKTIYGITNYEELQTLHKYIKGYEEKVIEIRVLLNTVKSKDNYVECKMRITFKSENELDFVLRIKNDMLIVLTKQ